MSSPIKAFKQDHLLKDPQAVIPKNDLYSGYVSYCIENGLPVKAKNAFSMKLYQILPDIAETRIRKGKARIQCWKGVKYSKDKIIEDPDRSDQGDQNGADGHSGQPGQGSTLFYSKKCAFCGIPLNAETGEFMDKITMRYYCRDHFASRVSELYGEGAK